jgi:Domain of unknown function (DUF4136)
MRPACSYTLTIAVNGVSSPMTIDSAPQGLLDCQIQHQVSAMNLKPLALTLLAAAGLYAQKVTIEFDETVDFSKFKTFAIRDGQLISRNPALNSELVKKRIDADIESALTAKGLMKVTGKSDLNVRYQLGTARKTELETYPAGWRGWGTRVRRVPYAEGTLVVDLRDPSTRSLVWRAIASVDKLEDMVRKSIEKYPPKPK